MSGSIRILFVADSHIGTDLPVRPRVARRRRGEDFLDNHARALEPALRGEADLVVHGGDIFDRPRIDRGVAHRAYAPLLAVADRGVPVFIVPGNHERSVLPHGALLRHPHVHVFDAPRTFTSEHHGLRLALAGFPYVRGVRHRMGEMLDATAWRTVPADVRLLCVHHCVEGATVGPGDFTFTTAADVIRHRDVPPEFAAVLSGHIHRQQVLTHDLKRRPLRTPVLYPGSVERTSAAEMAEEKGYLMLRLHGDARIEWESRPLPARPLITHDLNAAGMCSSTLHDDVASIIAAQPPDAVLRIRVHDVRDDVRLPPAAAVRALAPASMNVELRIAGVRGGRRSGQRDASTGVRRGAARRSEADDPAGDAGPEQLALF